MVVTIIILLFLSGIIKWKQFTNKSKFSKEKHKNSLDIEEYEINNYTNVINEIDYNINLTNNIQFKYKNQLSNLMKILS